MYSTYKVVIIDKDASSADKIAGYLNTNDALNVLGVFDSFDAFANENSGDELDIIYLAIESKDDLNALSVFSTKAAVVVISTTSDAAVLAYEMDVVHYGLQPASASWFTQGTRKAICAVGILRKANDKQSGFHPMKSEMPAFIMLKAEKRYIKVFVDDIIYVESDWNYVKVVTANEKITTLRTMKGIEEKLAPYHFQRIHKSFLINLNQVDVIEGNMVQLKGNTLQIGRSYKASLLSFFKLNS